MYRQSCFYDLIDYQPENKLFVFSVLVFVAEFFLVEDKLLSAMRADNDFIGIFIKIVCVYFKCFAAVGTFSLIIFLALIAVAVIMAIVAITIIIAIAFVCKIILNITEAFVNFFDIIIKAFNFRCHFAYCVDKSGDKLALSRFLVIVKSVCKA